MIQYKILWTNVIKIVWLTLRRITNLIWELKGKLNIVAILFPLCILTYWFVFLIFQVLHPALRPFSLTLIMTDSFWMRLRRKRWTTPTVFSRGWTAWLRLFHMPRITVILWLEKMCQFGAVMIIWGWADTQRCWKLQGKGSEKEYWGWNASAFHLLRRHCKKQAVTNMSPLGTFLFLQGDYWKAWSWCWWYQKHLWHKQLSWNLGEETSRNTQEGSSTALYFLLCSQWHYSVHSGSSITRWRHIPSLVMEKI